MQIDTLDDDTLAPLQKLHNELKSLEGVQKVSSIFSNDFIENKYDTNSSNMLVVLNCTEVDSLTLKQLLKKKTTITVML